MINRLVSKVLANRIKTILPNIISNAQTAFVPVRLITENIFIACEMLHRLRNKRKSKIGHMTAKLDISKAYARVEWEFLPKIMKKLSFNGRRIHLAMQYVSTVSYSVLLKGEPHGLILPSRGIK